MEARSVNWKKGFLRLWAVASVSWVLFLVVAYDLHNASRTVLTENYYPEEYSPEMVVENPTDLSQPIAPGRSYAVILGRTIEFEEDIYTSPRPERFATYEKIAQEIIGANKEANKKITYAKNNLVGAIILMISGPLFLLAFLLSAFWVMGGFKPQEAP